MKESYTVCIPLYTEIQRKSLEEAVKVVGWLTLEVEWNAFHDSVIGE